MTEHDDATMLAFVGNSLAGVHMDTPVSDVTARGRKLRHRRTAATGLATTGIAAIATLAVALPSSGGGTATAQARQTVTIAQGVNVDTAAWSVHTNADSTVSVTLREVIDTDQLQQVLAKAGVRARVQLVHNGLAGCDSVMKDLPQAEQVFIHRTASDLAHKDATVVTIRPSAMPAGSYVSIIVDDFGRAFVLGGKGMLAFQYLLVHGMPVTCVSR